MNIGLAKAFAEIDEILLLMESKYVEKIPQKLRDLFHNEKMAGYEPVIDKYTPLDEQNLQRKTFVILAILNLNYWCEDEEEKQKLISAYAENDRIMEEELREKYNPDNLFKKKIEQEETEKSNVALVEYREENFFKKIIKKVMSFFKRN